MSREFYDAQEHQLNKRLLSTVRHTIATWRAMRPGRDAEELADALKRVGFEIPVLYCEGYTRDDDPCGLRLDHEGECRFG